jgi:DNA modification methylase
MKRGILDTYHISDARQLLSVLPAIQFVDTTITSPPYWNLKDYGSKNQVGFGQKYDEYLEDLAKIFSAVNRVTKSAGSLWIVVDTIKHNGELKLFPFDLANKLTQSGWILHDIIIWHKDKTLPWSHRGKLRNIFEYVLFFSKGKHFKYNLAQVRETEGLKEWWLHYPERYSPQGKAPTRTWSIPIPRQGSWGENWVRHFCPFPPELIRRIVRLTTKKGDIVLDPFAGSGVVLAQAKALDRRYVGFDLRKAYRRMFEKKVLPSIIALEKRSQKSALTERKRDRFSAVIWKLRKTKYPRELLRLYEKKHGKSGIAGLIVHSRQRNVLDIVFIFAAGKAPPKHFTSRLEQLMRFPPLSKYGLRVKAKPHVLNLNGGTITGLNGFNSRELLNLYVNGKTHSVHSQLPTGKFLQSLRDGARKKQAVPTIGSNIRVSASKEMRF